MSGQKNQYYERELRHTGILIQFFSFAYRYVWFQETKSPSSSCRMTNWSTVWNDLTTNYQKWQRSLRTNRTRKDKTLLTTRVTYIPLTHKARKENWMSCFSYIVHRGQKETRKYRWKRTGVKLNVKNIRNISDNTVTRTAMYYTYVKSSWITSLAFFFFPSFFLFYLFERMYFWIYRFKCFAITRHLRETYATYKNGIDCGFEKFGYLVSILILLLLL